MKKAIVFVDANNWYHNIKHFFNPVDVSIKNLSNLLCMVKGYQLEEIRWYASIPHIEDGEEKYYKHISFLEHLRKQGITVITRKLQKLSNKEVVKKKKKVLQDLNIFDDCKKVIETHFLSFLDIKRKEKGIDVWIAVDIIKLGLIENKYDVCVLISGDADYVPALDLIKDKKEILVGMTPFGFATELRQKYPYFILRKSTLQKVLDDVN